MVYNSLKLSKNDKTGYLWQENNEYFLFDNPSEKRAGSENNPGQANEFKVLQRISKILAENISIFSEIPEFLALKEQFSQLVDQVNIQYQENRNSLIDIISKISDGLRNYGVMTDNEEIISLASVKKNSLYELEDHELLQRASGIILHAKSYISSLYLFGVQYNCLTEAVNQAKALAYITGVSGTDVFEETEWKRRIDEIFNDANCFVHEKLDKLIENIKDQYPQLLREYVSAKLA